MVGQTVAHYRVLEKRSANSIIEAGGRPKILDLGLTKALETETAGTTISR